MSKHLSPAYQLYSAREDASNDLEGVLDQLSRMGYEGVEFAGFFERSAKEVRKLLKHTGLKAVSSHVPLQQIRDDTQSVLDYHEELECGCIAVPYLAEEDRPGQPGFARVLETLYTYFISHASLMPPEYLAIAEKEDVHRAVCDYISGMSDGYAVDLYQELFIPKSWKS